MFKDEKTEVPKRNRTYIQPYTGKGIKQMISDPGYKSYVALYIFYSPMIIYFIINISPYNKI